MSLLSFNEFIEMIIQCFLVYFNEKRKKNQISRSLINN